MRRPQSLVLVFVIVAAGLSGCFGAKESDAGINSLNLQIAHEDAGVVALPRGQPIDFTLNGEEGAWLEVPDDVLMFVNHSLVTTGYLHLDDDEEVYGQILATPYTIEPVILKMMALDGSTLEIEVALENETPIVSGQEWYQKMDFITSVCDDSTKCGAYINRWMGSPNPNFERAASFFQGHFAGLGYETHILRVIDHLNPTEPESLNLIAWQKGRNSSCVQGMGAHMDIAPPGGPPGGGTYEGAYDNTAGTVSMMLFAKAFKELEIEFECDTFLALWSSEEEGLRGSSAFATNDCDYCLPKDKELRFYINMDMMGISWPAKKSTGDPFPYHAWSGPDTDPAIIEQPITYIMDHVIFDVQHAPRNLSIDGSYGAGCDQHWDEHDNLTMDVHEDTFGRSDHVTFRNLGAQTIFHLGAYDADYDAYHSPSDTLDNMAQVVGGQEELEKSIQFVMWSAFMEFLFADQEPLIRNVG